MSSEGTKTGPTEPGASPRGASPGLPPFVPVEPLKSEPPRTESVAPPSSLPPKADSVVPKLESLPPKSETAQKSVPPPEERKKDDESPFSVALGVVFWLVIATFIAAAVFRTNDGKILLEVAHGENLVVEGAVTYEGAPIDGKVEVVLDDRKTGRHLGSMLLDTKDGRFSSRGKTLSDIKRNTELHIHASFIGTFVNDEKKRDEVVAEQTVYTNCPPPFSDRSLMMGFGVVGAVSVVLLFLFTGNYTRRSAAFLFGSAYLFTFLSVTLPIVGLLYLAQNHYVIEVMKRSPIGIVRGRTNAVASPQWLLNLGGVVVEPSEGEPPKTPAATEPEPKPEVVATAKPTATPTQPASASAAAPAAPAPSAKPDVSTRSADATKPADGTALAAGSVAPVRSAKPVSSAAPANPAATTPPVVAVVPAAAPEKTVTLGAPLPLPLPGAPTPAASAMLGFPVVYGGLAIPFYVILLAVFGAGINMMRRVPQIQSEHIPKLPEPPPKSAKSVLKIPFTSATPRETDEQVIASCKIRKEVIEQYMYLLSAPFLAIAVYYLLQIVAANISEPVLVLMAFSAGLVSESIVTAIIQFAEGTIAQIGKSGSDARKKSDEEKKRETGLAGASGATGATGPVGT